MAKNIIKQAPSQIVKNLQLDTSERIREFKKSFTAKECIRDRLKLTDNTFYKCCRTETSSTDNEFQQYQKNSSLSQQFREEGNSFYKRKGFVDAIRCYNKSLAFAPTDDCNIDKSLPLAYGNRSALFCQMKNYEASLQDIKRALKSGYPDKDRYKLLERRGKCLTAMNDVIFAEEAYEEAKRNIDISELSETDKIKSKSRIDKAITQLRSLSFMSAQKLTSTFVDLFDSSSLRNKELTQLHENSCMSSSSVIKMKKSEGKGRYFIATEDISVGQNILCETSTVCVLHEKYLADFCYKCLVKLKNPVPCNTCTKVLYCCEICRDDCYHAYHKDECIMLDSFNNFTHQDSEELPSTLALRCLLSMKSEDFDKVDSLGYQTNETQDVSIFTLISHISDASLEQQLLFTFTALHATYAIRNSPFWKRVVKKNKDLDEDPVELFATFLIHFLSASVCNTFQVSSYEIPENNDFRNARLHYIALCLCPQIAMTNHSCNPSADVEFYSNRCVLRASRNISAGEEVNIDYGPHYTEGRKECRQSELLKKFFFRCDCQACMENWPEVEDQEKDMPRFRCENCRLNLLDLLSEGDILKCSNCNHKQNVFHMCKKLEESHNAYGEAMLTVGEADDMDPRSLIGVLEHHISLMDRWISLPWQDYARCQATLRQLYRCMGNHFYGSVLSL